MALKDFTTVDDIGELRVVGSLFSQICITSFRFRLTAITGTITPAQFAAAMADEYWDDGVDQGIRHMTCSSYSGVTLTGQKIKPTRYISEVYTPPNQSGVVIGVSLAPSVTGVVRKKSTLSGRKYRGRWFIPGVPSAWSASGQLSSTGLTAYAAASLNWATPKTITAGGGTGTFNPIIYSTRHPLNTQPIAAVETDPVLRSQRRREIGKGI